MGNVINEAELIGRIYESSEGDSQDFGRLFEVLGESLGAVSGHHLVIEENRTPETHDFGGDPAAFTRYLTEFQAVDPRLRIAQQNPTASCRTSMSSTRVHSSGRRSTRNSSATWTSATPSSSLRPFSPVSSWPKL